MILQLKTIMLLCFTVVIILQSSGRRKWLLGLLGLALVTEWILNLNIDNISLSFQILIWTIGLILGTFWIILYVSAIARFQSILKFFRENSGIFFRQVYKGIWEECLWRGAMQNGFIDLNSGIGLPPSISIVLAVILTTGLFYFAHRFSTPSKAQFREFIVFFGMLGVLVAIGMPIFLVAGLHSGRNSTIQYLGIFCNDCRR
jgi:hypothetical protein